MLANVYWAEEKYDRISMHASPQLEILLQAIQESLSAPVFEAKRSRTAFIQLFEFLASPAGRSDANCRRVGAVLLGLLSDSSLESAPRSFTEFVASADCLHDAIENPSIAENFESTPEHLLRKARALGA
jgi:hypothetical protein